MHASIYRLTGGLLGGRVRELGALLLTTTGRKSGQERTTPLNYLKYGSNYVVVASNSGRDEHPNWYLNLQADPRARVQVGRSVKEVVARDAPPEERDRLWPVLTRKARNYADYERLTSRHIPMVVLKPVERAKKNPDKDE